MVVVKSDDYTFKKFKKSNTKNKKYDAILIHKKTGRTKTVPFGDIRYEQYKDSTGLGLYSHKNHGDEKRRKNYISRHNKTAKNKFSSSWFSMYFLW